MSTNQLGLDIFMPDLNDDQRYRFHMAKTEPTGTRPLDALATSTEKWLQWQHYRGNNKERFTKDHIVTFAQISGNRFLFGGVCEITNRDKPEYEVRYTRQYENLVARLVLELHSQNKRLTVFKPETIYAQASIAGLYEQPFRGEPFVSYENINHGFSAMEIIVHNDLPDWKAALASVYGIYLLTDRQTGKWYVGSAYGEGGIWGRWKQYVNYFHGSNKMLTDLFDSTNEEYFRENFQFSVLEVLSPHLSKTEVVAKESLWKNKLLSRLHGYNSN